MALPKYDDLMQPLLELLGDGLEHHQRDLAPRLAAYFKLTGAELGEMLPNTAVSRFRHRLGWAGFHLRHAGLASLPRQGFLQITDEGKKFLATKPGKITRTVLMQFEPWREYIRQLRAGASDESGSQPGDEKNGAEDAASEGGATPEERIDRGYADFRATLAAEVLSRVKLCDPIFFEQLVVDLLLKMGYGGSRAEAGQATKISGDGGIDGVINEDRLGLDAVYVQAKKWEGSVGEPQLRDFVGALHANRATKGVFITTGEFTANAKTYVDKVGFKISLIDGRRLAGLMIDFGVGVSLTRNYEIKRIDSDYFEEG
jgi:restriction system protein